MVFINNEYMKMITNRITILGNSLTHADVLIAEPLTDDGVYELYMEGGGRDHISSRSNASYKLK